MPLIAWIAYTADESGRPEIYVRAFAGTGDKYQVSANAGYQPRWSRDGKELYFISLDSKLVAAAVRTSAGAFQRETREYFLKLRG